MVITGGRAKVLGAELTSMACAAPIPTVLAGVSSALAASNGAIRNLRSLSQPRFEILNSLRDTASASDSWRSRQIRAPTPASSSRPARAAPCATQTRPGAWRSHDTESNVFATAEDDIVATRRTGTLNFSARAAQMTFHVPTSATLSWYLPPISMARLPSPCSANRNHCERFHACSAKHRRQFGAGRFPHFFVASQLATVSPLRRPGVSFPRPHNRDRLGTVSRRIHRLCQLNLVEMQDHLSSQPLRQLLLNLFLLVRQNHLAVCTVTSAETTSRPICTLTSSSRLVPG